MADAVATLVSPPRRDFGDEPDGRALEVAASELVAPAHLHFCA